MRFVLGARTCRAGGMRGEHAHAPEFGRLGGHACQLLADGMLRAARAQVVRLSRTEDEMALEHYLCSYSTQGITLDATLRCRPAGLIRSRMQCAAGC